MIIDCAILIFTEEKGSEGEEGILSKIEVLHAFAYAYLPYDTYTPSLRENSMHEGGRVERTERAESSTLNLSFCRLAGVKKGNTEGGICINHSHHHFADNPYTYTPRWISLGKTFGFDWNGMG
jgi:hypothetical protein